MKKNILMTAQVLVSVFILAYLFNSIFEREAGEELKPIATEPATSRRSPPNSTYRSRPSRSSARSVWRQMVDSI